MTKQRILESLKKKIQNATLASGIKAKTVCNHGMFDKFMCNNLNHKPMESSSKR